ncbi:uncharacterized protein [Typha angustifolia]|uniref:uncharacterized protein isoform X2 n=1 Tax=Typha angustifolia TaxID=59011 RepID=UPI003C2DA40D
MDIQSTEENKFDLDHVDSPRRCSQDFYSHVHPSRPYYARLGNIYSDLPHSGGIDYLGSQQPSEFSQANAMGVVDKLLSENDTGSSQEVSTSKVTVKNSASILSAKVAQCLASRADRSCSIRKARIFDWVDGLEDEAGGTVFSRVNDFSSENRGKALQSQSLIIGGACDKSGDKEARNLKIYPRPNSSTCSSSTLLSESLRSEKPNMSEAENEEVQKHMDDQSSLIYLEQQTEATDVLEDIYGTDDVGPNTQIAAEAMETLFHGPYINHVLREDAHPNDQILSKDCTKEASSVHDLLEKMVPSCHDLEGTTSHSKRRKVFSTGITEGIPRPSEKYLDNSTVRKKLSNAAEKTKVRGSLARHPNGFSEQTKAEACFVLMDKRIPPKKLIEHTTPSAKLCDVLSSKRSSSSKGSNRIIGLEMNIASYSQVPDKKCKSLKEHSSPSLTEGPFSRLKVKRTHALTLGNSTVDCNMNNQSLLVNAKGSLADILDKAKRKRRSTLTKSQISAAGSTDSSSDTLALVTSEVLLKEVSKSNHLAESSNIEHVNKENVKDKVQQSSLTCPEPLREINRVLPTCRVQVPAKASGSRELLMLERKEEVLNWLIDRRRKKDMTRVRALFSQHLDQQIIKQQRKILARFGAPVVSSISEATHFIADKFARTRNMLEAIAMGKPVVTCMWLESCRQASYFIDEKCYILRDLVKEKEIGFSMPVSLCQARRYPLLQGRRVLITPKAKPDRELLISLVKAAHGQPLERNSRAAMTAEIAQDNIFIISCEEDYEICLPLLKKGIEAFNSELLLNGIVIQKLEFQRHRLFAGLH